MFWMDVNVLVTRIGKIPGNLAYRNGLDPSLTAMPLMVI